MAIPGLNPSDVDRIEAAALELRSTIDDFFCDARCGMSLEQWEQLTNYASACVRRVLEVGSLLHSIADAREKSAIPYAGRGRRTFVRGALDAWKDSYAPVAEPWKLALLFEHIPGGEKRVFADIAALEVMAANRLSASLDDEYERLFATES